MGNRTTLSLLALATSVLMVGVGTSASASEVVDPSRSTQTEVIVGSVDDGSTVFETEVGSLAVAPSTDADPADLQLLASSISCSLNVQNVHASSHVSGTINGVARVDCTAPAGRLQISYSLIRLSPYTQWGGPTNTNSGSTGIQSNRAVPCSAGPAQFRGWAEGVITPPPGYTLVGPAKAQSYGNITNVACGVNRVAGGGEEQVLTVTFVRNDLR